jgi:hypothetical protein
MVADHWVKGPHHFWIEVETNRMVREWQPFNGLQTFAGRLKPTQRHPRPPPLFR